MRSIVYVNKALISIDICTVKFYNRWDICIVKFHDRWGRVADPVWVYLIQPLRKKTRSGSVPQKKAYLDSDPAQYSHNQIHLLLLYFDIKINISNWYLNLILSLYNIINNILKERFNLRWILVLDVQTGSGPNLISNNGSNLISQTGSNKNTRIRSPYHVSLIRRMS